MVKIIDDFVEYWTENHYLPIIQECRVQREIYDAIDFDNNWTKTEFSEKPKYREWLKHWGFKDYACDLYIPYPNLDSDVDGFSIEFDGHGLSHTGKNAERDRNKSNQLLKLNVIPIRYSIQTLKNSIPFVLDDITEIIEAW